MKVFKINDKVFFNLGGEIFEGTIDRNNGVSTGTYTILYEVKKGELFKNIYNSDNLFRTKEEVEEKIILGLENDLSWKKERLIYLEKEVEEKKKLIKKVEEKILKLKK